MHRTEHLNHLKWQQKRLYDFNRYFSSKSREQYSYSRTCEVRKGTLVTELKWKFYIFNSAYDFTFLFGNPLSKNDVLFLINNIIRDWSLFMTRGERNQITFYRKKFHGPLDAQRKIFVAYSTSRQRLLRDAAAGAKIWTFFRSPLMASQFLFLFLYAYYLNLKIFSMHHHFWLRLPPRP